MPILSKGSVSLMLKSFPKANSDVYIKTADEDDEKIIYINSVNCDFVEKLSENIIKKYERPLLLKVLKERYPYLTRYQKNYVLSAVENFNLDKDVGFIARLDLVSEAVYKFISEGRKKLYPEGFATFRLRKYEDALDELIEKVLEDSFRKREYEEFISLLKYFVSVNDNRPGEVSILVRTDGVYELYDEKGKNITKKCMADFLSDGEKPDDISFDDLLISMLITLAPKKITFHGGEKIKNKDLMKTIAKVFDENVHFCEGCTLCKR